MFLTCCWLYGKGKKILQQAAGKLRSQALARGARVGQGNTWEVFKRGEGRESRVERDAMPPCLVVRCEEGFRGSHRGSETQRLGGSPKKLMRMLFVNCELPIFRHALK
jgi:hypothetical protein